MTLEEFEKALQQHDWTFMLSDDGDVYRAGRASRDKLEALAQEIGQDAIDLYNRYIDKFNVPTYKL